MREFLHVADLAQAVKFSLENTLEKNLYNVGTGVDITIKDLAKIVEKIIGFKGETVWDSSKPDGTPRKLLDINLLKKESWIASIPLEQGIKMTYNWYLENKKSLRILDF